MTRKIRSSRRQSHADGRSLVRNTVRPRRRRRRPRLWRRRWLSRRRLAVVAAVSGGGYGGGGFRGYGGGGYGGYRGGYGGMSSFSRTPSFSSYGRYWRLRRRLWSSRRRRWDVRGPDRLRCALGFVHDGARRDDQLRRRGSRRPGPGGGRGRAGRVRRLGHDGRRPVVRGCRPRRRRDRAAAGTPSAADRTSALSPGPRGTAVAGHSAYGVSGGRPNGFNSYGGYHSGWVHGYWNGHNDAAWGWRGGYWGGWGWGGGWGFGLGLASGSGWAGDCRSGALARRSTAWATCPTTTSTTLRMRGSASPTTIRSRSTP